MSQACPLRMLADSCHFRCAERKMRRRIKASRVVESSLPNAVAFDAIMSFAEQLNVAIRAGAALGHRDDVIKFKVRVASAARLFALPLRPPPHLIANFDGNVSCAVAVGLRASRIFVLCSSS